MYFDESFAESFSGKRIFVTGHTGFKGSWLVSWLLEMGAKVTGFSLPADGEELLFDQLKIADRLTDLRGDIRNLSALQKALVMARPEMVFHLAAQPLVRVSYHQPLETLAVNVMGTAHLLEACRALKERCAVVCITSDKCYRNRECLHAYAEDEPLGGYDPYSASKAAAEIIIASFRDSYFPASGLVHVASARAGNVIGGGDWAKDRLVPDCVRALKSGEVVKVRNPASTRPWQHVLEPLSGYLFLAAALSRSDASPELASAFNFGPDAASHRTVRDVVEAVLRHWPGRWQDASDAASLHEAGKLSLATGKASRLLGWKPVWNFDQTVDQTVAWYRRHAEGASAWELTKAQIHDYLEQARHAPAA
jgi:CDP-glucose 4,6-dehydratase